MAKENKFQQTFEKATILRGGKEIDLYNHIQEASEDTDLYKIQEKYHGLENAPLDLNEMQGEFTTAISYTDIYKQQQEVEKMWYNLPLKVRKEFNNDPREFVENGDKWIKEQIELAKPKTIPQEPTTEPTTKE